MCEILPNHRVSRRLYVDGRLVCAEDLQRLIAGKSTLGRLEHQLAHLENISKNTGEPLQQAEILAHSKPSSTMHVVTFVVERYINPSA